VRQSFYHYVSVLELKLFFQSRYFLITQLEFQTNLSFFSSANETALRRLLLCIESQLDVQRLAILYGI
jgi:hypothetical protein